MATVLQQIVIDTIECVPPTDTITKRYQKGDIFRWEGGEWKANTSAIFHTDRYTETSNNITGIGDVHGVATAAEFNAVPDTQNNVVVTTAAIASGITKVHAIAPIAIGSSVKGNVWLCNGSTWALGGGLPAGPSVTIHVANTFSVTATDQDFLVLTANTTKDATTKLSKSDANTGKIVTLSADQSGGSSSTLASPKIQEATSWGDKIAGVLLDWHHNKMCTVGRKGRFSIASTEHYTSAMRGKSIHADFRDGYEADAVSIHKGGTGEIIGGGIHSVISKYFIVDLNLP